MLNRIISVEYLKLFNSEFKLLNHLLSFIALAGVGSIG